MNTRNMTKKQVIQEHRKMWNWIADQLENRRETVFKLKREYCSKNNFNLLHYCFCCDYNFSRNNSILYECEQCPLLWGSEEEYYGYFCEHSSSSDKIPKELYKFELDEGLWRIAYGLSEHKQYSLAAEYARKIANLPEKP